MVLNFNNKEIFFLAYLICMNLFSFILFGIDKKKAKKKEWRIPEASLIGVSVFGGSLGALMGMVIFKHKLSKKIFYIGIPLIILVTKIVEIIIFNLIRN
jgi:uncharacterized membrane protein YsdA (DUF1294 family)